MSDSKYYKKAKKRVKKKKEFYQLLVTFSAISVFLIALNLFSSPSQYWFFYPVGGMMLALVFVGYEAFGFGEDPEWEEREIAREMKKMNKGKTPAIESPEEEPLELKELKELRPEWKDSDFV